MVGKEEPRRGEAKARARHLLPISLRLHIPHPLLPNNVRIDRILHNRGDPVLLLRVLSTTGRREGGGDGTLDRFPPPREHGREAEKELSGGDREGFPLGGRRFSAPSTAAAALLLCFGGAFEEALVSEKKSRIRVRGIGEEGSGEGERSEGGHAKVTASAFGFRSHEI